MADLLAAGTIIALSASAPGTFDGSGYGALSYTTVGEADEIQGDIGRLYNMVQRFPLAGAGRPSKKKGNYNDGNIQLPMALDYSDTGQNLVRTAIASANPYSFKITLPNSTVIYGQALVLGATVNIGGTESFIMANATLEIITSTTGVGIVVV